VPCTGYTVRREAVVLLASVTCQDHGKRVSVKGVFLLKRGLPILACVFFLKKKEIRVNL
jgi:hypothetical protein